MGSNRTAQACLVLQSRANSKCPLRSRRKTCLGGVCLCLEMIERWQKHLCHKRTEPVYVGRTFWAEGNSLCQRNSHCCLTGVNCFPSTMIMVLKIFFSPEFTRRLSPLRTSGKITDSNQKPDQGFWRETVITDRRRNEANIWTVKRMRVHHGQPKVDRHRQMKFWNLIMHRAVLFMENVWFAVVSKF